MSWLKSAVNKAVEVGNRNTLTRAVKNYADSVVHQAGQAVAEGAKLLQDRMGAKNYRSVKHTIKRLEEAAVSCRGAERVQLLRRWVTALNEMERVDPSFDNDKHLTAELHVPADDGKESPRRPSMVMYHDADVGGLPMNFRTVFLQSQALEGITLSMIITPPSTEEISLLLEMFSFCLCGGKEVHNALISSIQDLAVTFSNYEDEVMAKREELLQFARSAISGLKISADVGRIDAEVKTMKDDMVDIKDLQIVPTYFQGKTSDEKFKATMEGLKKALTQVRICSKLEVLLLKKKSVSNGDPQEVHAQKVEKLKILSESLASSTAKSEKRILDQRSQKQEALNVRATKATESDEREKELKTELAALEKERDELEAKLKKVNVSLTAVNSRLRDAKDERHQFDEANNLVIEHLKTKENDLSKSITACKVEGNVLNTWINFLEDAWALQQSSTDVREKQATNELEEHEIYFLKLAIHLLSGYKEMLEPSINRIAKFVENLKSLPEGSINVSAIGNSEDSSLNPRKHVEEEYLEHEAQIVTTFSVVDNMKELFYSQRGAASRKSDTTVKTLFDDIERLRKEFESIERPSLEIETPPPMAASAHVKPPESPSHIPIPDTVSPKSETHNPKTDFSDVTEETLDPAAELAKFESEFGKVGRDYSSEEIADWEFDELERELRSDHSEIAYKRQT